MTHRTSRPPRVRVLAAEKRPAVEQALRDSPVLARWISVGDPLLPDGPCEPLLLDVETFPPLALAGILARLNATHELPALALVSPGNAGAIRLLMLCEAVGVIAGDLGCLIGHLAAGGQVPLAPARRVWLRATPPYVPAAGPDALRLIAALAEAPTMDAAAARLHIARRTLFRRLQELRRCLAVEGDSSRLSPAAHAAALLQGYYRDAGASVIQPGT
jgi:hypothetical protein